MLPDQSQLDLLAATLNNASPGIAVFLFADTLAGGGRLPLPVLVQQLLGPHAEIGGVQPLSAEAALELVRHCLASADEMHSPGLTRAGLLELQGAVGTVLDGLAASLADARLIEHFWLSAGHPAYPELWDFAIAVRTRTDALVFVGAACSA